MEKVFHVEYFCLYFNVCTNVELFLYVEADRRRKLFLEPLRRRLRSENTLEAFAVLKEDRNPQHASDQPGSDTAWVHRQVERKDVVELRRKQCQRKGHKKAGEQQQSTQDLDREKPLQIQHP